MPVKVRGSSSWASRGICSLTFDVVDGSCEGNAAPRPAESDSHSVSPEAAEDPADQQREPKQSQVARETQTSFEGAEDVCTEQEPLSPKVEENTAADKPAEEEEVDTDHVKEEETETDHLESTQDIPGGSEVEDNEETQTTKGSEPEPEDPSSEAAAATGDGEQDDRDTGGDADADDDGGICEEKPEEAEEQAELKDEEVETTKEDNPEQSCSAEPDVDSSSTLREPPERFISEKRDHRVRDSRSLRYLKVLQAPVVPS